MSKAIDESEKIRREKIAAVADASPAAIDCGVYRNVWQIRVYDFTEFWVACFFHCDLWHEHATADSKAEAIESAKRRIDYRILEGR